MKATSAVLPALHRRVVKLMGNRFEISLVCEDEAHATHCMEKAIAEIRRIESLLTTFHPDSQTNRINELAGIRPATVDPEVFQLIERSLGISRLTQGAFDISYGSIDKKLWNFDTNMTALPDKETAKRSVRLINYRNIVFNKEERTVFLKEKGMRIGFGGIGKGYAAQMARQLLLQQGLEGGVVNAAGDLAAWGHQPDGKPWTIGIADPDTRHPFSQLSISNVAVATSGNYEKFAVIDGKKWSHTLDPRTGYPVSGIRSVTVICPNAELADAMATPVMVMGVEAGLHLINQMEKIACVIIDEQDRIHTSRQINLV